MTNITIVAEASPMNLQFSSRLRTLAAVWRTTRKVHLRGTREWAAAEGLAGHDTAFRRAKMCQNFSGTFLHG